MKAVFTLMLVFLVVVVTLPVIVAPSLWTGAWGVFGWAVLIGAATMGLGRER